ncbi:MAG: hypothetical protein U9R74_00375 [Pseudomonadota bacterium]|nr:hypothetical protein [Pseudomonadota bacterium]
MNSNIAEMIIAPITGVECHEHTKHRGPDERRDMVLNHVTLEGNADPQVEVEGVELIESP